MTDNRQHRGRHYTAIDYAPPAAWGDFRYAYPGFAKAVPGKHFLREPLALTGAEISLNSLGPGKAVPFLHRHRTNEEIYVFLDGQGEFQVDDDVLPVAAGSCIRVDPAGRRSWRNVGDTPLSYLVIQVVAGSYAGTGTIEDGEVLPEAPAWAG